MEFGQRDWCKTLLRQQPDLGRRSDLGADSHAALRAAESRTLDANDPDAD